MAGQLLDTPESTFGTGVETIMNVREEHQSVNAGHAGPRTVRSRVVVAMRYAVGLGLLGVLGAMVEWDAARTVLASARLELMLLAAAAVLADRMLQAWVWILLLEVKLREIRRSDFVRMHFIATFLGQFVPFNIGSDVAKVMAAARYSGDTMACVSSVVVVRVLGLVSLLFSVALVVAAALALQVSAVGRGLAWTILAALAAGGAIGFVLLRHSHAVSALAATLAHGRWSRSTITLKRAYEACRSYGDHNPTLVAVFALLQASLLNAVLITYLVAGALGIDVPLGYFFLFVPLIAFLGQLPISPNGIGVAEGGYVFFFVQAGASPSEALVLGIAIRVLMTLAALPGGVLLMFQGWPVRPGAVAADIRSRGVAGL